MNQVLKTIEEKYTKKVPALRPGDTVRVHQKIKEGNKERIQVFEGVVLRVKGSGIKSSFLVRKISFGIGIEKNFLIYSPNIAKIEVKKRAKVRQAYLGYLRNLRGKSARLRDKQFDTLAVNVKDEPEQPEETPEAKEDAEITELSPEEMAEPTAEESIDEVIKEENKQAENEDLADQTGSDMEDQDQQAESEAIAEGLGKADKDLEKGKASEGERAEKSTEDVTQEDIKEEIKDEQESK